MYFIIIIILFDGNNPGIKTDVVDHLRDRMQDAMKDEKKLSGLLQQIGDKPRPGESVRAAADRVIRHSQQAWDILNKRTDLKTYDMTQKVWRQSRGMKNIDLVSIPS